MARINLDNYVTVDQRLVKFWEQYPRGCVDTELLFVDNMVVRVKATVYADRTNREHSLLSTGHAEEYRITEAQIKNNPKLKDLPNATSAVENCETSAVGRALALAGYEVTKGVASREEMEKVRRQSEAREKISEVGVDNGASSDTVVASEEVLSYDEARMLAGQIKATGIEMGAVKLKMVGMGIEESKTLSGTLQTMSKEQGQELYAWVLGQNN